MEEIEKVAKRVKLDSKGKAIHDYTEATYICGYCGKKFKMDVTKISYASPIGRRYNQRHSVSTQVKCPRCGNFLKTWE